MHIIQVCSVFSTYLFSNQMWPLLLFFSVGQPVTYHSDYRLLHFLARDSSPPTQVSWVCLHCLADQQLYTEQNRLSALLFLVQALVSIPKIQRPIFTQVHLFYYLLCSSLFSTILRFHGFFVPILSRNFTERKLTHSCFEWKSVQLENNVRRRSRYMWEVCMSAHPSLATFRPIQKKRE